MAKVHSRWLEGSLRRGHHTASAIGLCLISLIASGATPALAATEVTGQADQLELEVNNASTQDALDALARAFGFTYQLPAEVSHELNGRYRGTLQQVLGRILDRNNYIIKPVEGRLEVIVLGKSGSAGIAAPAPIVATPPAPPPPSVASVTSPSPASLPTPAVPTLSNAAPPPLASYLAGGTP